LLGGLITGVGAWLRGGGAGGLLSLGLCLAAPVLSAAQDAPRTEYFTGFEVSDNYASAYVGGGYAFGKAGLYDEGWRVRAVGAITMTARCPSMASTCRPFSRARTA
jgi:hypothetical protein